MKSVIYARISKEEQSRYSIEEQIKRCTDYIEREGHELVEVYVDDGFSAKNMKRPSLQQMLSDIKKKTFNMITVWGTDRLTRETIDGLTMVKDNFRPNGIEFASVTEDIDTSTPDGYMMFTIRLSMAQREREKIAERVSLGQIGRAKKGLRNSSAKPYGYDVGEELKLSVNEEEARIVKQIFEWYLQGWGRIKIARTLNNMMIPASKGGTWYEFIIGQILSNVVYTGATHYKPKHLPESERIIVRDTHEAIVSTEVFEQARVIFQRRRDHDMNLSSYDFVFSSILKCALCGRSFHGKHRHTGKYGPYRYYRCSGKYRPGSECNASDIAENVLTNLLFSMIKVTETKYDDEPIKKQDIDVEKERKRLEKLMNESKERRKKWSRAMGDNKMTYEEYSELVEEEKKRVQLWQEELDKLPKKAAQSGKSRKDVAKLLQNLSKEWDKLSNDQRKLIIQGLFKQIIIAKIGNEWKIMGYELA